MVECFESVKLPQVTHKVEAEVLLYNYKISHAIWHDALGY